MAERPEDLNLPNAVITRIIKEAVSTSLLSFFFPQKTHTFSSARYINYFVFKFYILDWSFEALLINQSWLILDFITEQAVSSGISTFSSGRLYP